MILRELMDVIPDEQNIVIWSCDRDGEEDEVYEGPAKKCPHGLGRFTVSFIDAGHFFIAIGIDEVPAGYL